MRLPPGLSGLELFVRRAWLDRELAGSSRVQQIVVAFAEAQMLTQGTVGLPMLLAQTLEQQPHFFPSLNAARALTNKDLALAFASTAAVGPLGGTVPLD